MTDRIAKHAELVARVKFFDPKTSLDNSMMKLCLNLLQTFSPESNPSSDVVINLAQEFLSPARTFFNDEFLANSLSHSTSLRLILEFYKSSPVTQEFCHALNLLDDSKDEKQVKTLIFLYRLYKFQRDDTLPILKHYGQACRLQFVQLSNKDNVSTNSDLSGNDDLSRRIEAQDAQLASLNESVMQITGQQQQQPPMHPTV